MIQQLKNTKTDKQFTQNDLAKVAYASCLNFFHTNSMFSPYPFGIYYSIDFYYVKRLNNDSYLRQDIWSSTKAGNSPSTMGASCGSTYTISRNKVKSLDTDLICDNDGDERLLIICAYRRKANSYEKSKLGFFLLNPQAVKYGIHKNHVDPDLLYEYLIITPKPGLFPAKNE